jgi:hypothetical protein
MVVSVDDGRATFEVLAVAIFAGVAFYALLRELFFPYMRRRSRSSKFRHRNFHIIQKATTELGDSPDQLRHVMQASFYKKKIMSKAEYKVFRIVESEIIALRNGCRVLSQTSLGEVIGSDSQKAFASINSKRVDILIIGPYGDPIAAVEYQGGRHHQGSAAARDAIKREALRRAGVHFVEIAEAHSPNEIAHLIRRLFLPPSERSDSVPPAS